MENYIRKIGKLSLVTSVLLLLIGFFMVTQSISFVNTLVILFGSVLMLDGVIHGLSYFSIEDEYRFFSYELAQAIIGIILGFVVVCNSEAVTTFLPIVFGIWITLDGILKLQIALNIRGVRNTNWGIMFILSMITIAIGASVMLHPISSLNFTTKACGSLIVITQLMNIYDDFYILSQVKEVKGSKKKSTKSSK